MSYGPMFQNPVTPPHGGRNTRRAMAFDYDGMGFYGGYEGLGWNPFSAIADAAKAVGGAVVGAVKTVAKPAISIAKTVLPSVPIVGSAAAGILELVTRGSGSPDAPSQVPYPGTAWPNTAPYVQGQGVNILEAIKQQLLRQAGTYVARTPEGQAAIKEEAMRQAKARASTTAKSVLPWLAAGIPLLLIATSPRKR